MHPSSRRRALAWSARDAAPALDVGQANLTERDVLYNQGYFVKHIGASRPI